MIDVFTGDCGNAGTDANVFLTIYGKNCNSGERKLASSKSNLNKFERNQVFLIIKYSHSSFNIPTIIRPSQSSMDAWRMVDGRTTVDG